MKEGTFIKITPQRIETQDVTFSDALELLCSALRQMALNLIERAEQQENDALPELRREIYDWINQSISGILHEIDPAQDPNADLDINEVIAMQDIYIHDALASLKATNPRLYRKAKKKTDKLVSEQKAKVIENQVRADMERRRQQDILPA